MKTLLQHSAQIRKTGLASLMLSALLGCMALTSTLSYAETVQIPVGQQGQDKQNIARPQTGMSQDQVKSQFGNPLEWTNPVGDPPITKWTYGDFVVYFEYDHVIHSVLLPSAQQASQTVAPAQSGQSSENDALSILSKDN